MRKKRSFSPGAFYHVGSRTNNKTTIFSGKLGQKIMLFTMRNAKNKYKFRLFNFCIMPTHIHLLISPADNTTLSQIMQWIKTQSAKLWNEIHGSMNHVWGDRYFVRKIISIKDFYSVWRYIDENPVKSGLVTYILDWKPSGAYHISKNINELVDYIPKEHTYYIKMLPPP